MDEDPLEELTTVDCPHCGKCMDVTEFRPFSLAVCPDCEGLSRVRAEMGPYLIEGKVGKGGMSVVFRARDTILSRHIALKILNENYSADESRISRFEQEARVMAQVQHPNIVKIYGVGRAQGFFYIAMEIIEGGDMESALTQSGKISEPDVLKLAIQVAQALKGASNAGLIHRDIKPANILVDDRGNAKIVDFGLSLLQNESDPDEEIWVTPFYASPEALAREEEDFRSDMYALGATLAHLLVGKIPVADLPKNASELREKKKKWPSLQKWCPEVSPMTVCIVDRLMCFSAEKRYNSYDQLIEDMNQSLNALLAGGNDWQMQRRVLRRRERRKTCRTWLLILVGGALFAGAIGWAISIWMKPSPNPVPVASVKPDKREKARVGMTPQEIEKTYRLGETFFREKDISGALRELGKISQDAASPLPIAAWASIQCTLMSRAIGDRSDMEDKFGLKSIRQRIGNISPEERQSLGLDQTETAMAWLLQPSGEETKKWRGRLGLSLLVGGFLDDWNASRCSLSLKSWKKLENLAKEQSDTGNFAREWLANLHPYQDDIGAWEKLQAMPEKTSRDISEKLTICRLLIEHPEKRKSPGDGFAGALLLYEKKLKVENQKALDREQQEQARNEKKARQEAREKEEREALAKIEQEKNIRETLEKELVEGMEKNWEFKRASEEFSKMLASIPYPPKTWKTRQEMAQMAFEFFSSVCKDIPALPAERRKIQLNDETSTLILGGTLESCRILDHGIQRTIPWASIPSSEFVRLHRESVSSGQKTAKSILKRHAGAIVFLFLTGQKDMAEKVASKLSDSDVEFAEKWMEWKHSLKEESSSLED